MAKQNQTHVLPHDHAMEQVVLGTLMLERGTLNEVREILTPETFYDPFHRKVYETILAIDARGDTPELLTVCQELIATMGEEFKAYEFSLLGNANWLDLYQHACLLKEKEKRRSLFQIGEYVSSSCFSQLEDVEEVISKAQKKLESLIITSNNTVSRLGEAVQGVYDQIDLNYTGENTMTGAPTGFSEFDQKAGGLHKSDLVIIAAETSMGKTSLAISMLMNSKSKVAFYSMEMKKEQIAARMIAIESKIPVNKILYSRLNAYQIECIDKGVSRIMDREVYFDDRSTSNIDMILASIRTMKLKYDIDGVVIDYLQILNVNMKGTSKEQQMADVARRLKNLAKELNIWIIALSQLNRDAQYPVPTLNRLRDSGQIAEAADVVMLVYRPEVYGRKYPEPFSNYATEATAMIDVAKGRNIGLMKFICRFEKEVTHFYEADSYPTEKEKEEEWNWDMDEVV